MEKKTFRPRLNKSIKYLSLFGLAFFSVVLFGAILTDWNISLVTAIAWMPTVILPYFLHYANYKEFVFDDDSLRIVRHILKPITLPYSSYKYQQEEGLCFDSYALDWGGFENKAELVSIIGEYQALGLIPCIEKTEPSKQPDSSKQRKNNFGRMVLILFSIMGIFILLFLIIFFIGYLLFPIPEFVIPAYVHYIIIGTPVLVYVLCLLINKIRRHRGK